MIEAHLAHSRETTPPESIHALPADALRAPGIRFWALYEDDTPLGCGALKDLGNGLAEVKSVHVAEPARRRGLARQIMTFLEAEARSAGYKAMALETGSALLPGFDAARALYRSLGFTPCGPIPGYAPDPYSVFLRLGLDPRSE
ncbi:GNAT family N-acetyltransferase [Sedimentitalea todarodis]|uniref:GNAT family N-acetyltransferase n=1 Tax=Sedimentitalea todarodis TaxID=1631240 RepID=A0ABU3VHS4_9RHOB|nr:GNAT family N-acetyltransferase [Sedimentitalea todarodis]MDU9005727.1 GNAT family N-acetyltransferase [Sedimentitalea todarodis]